MATIKGNPEATKKYREKKKAVLQKNEPERKAEAQKKAATNAAEAK